MPDSVHGLPGCGVSERIALEHVEIPGEGYAELVLFKGLDRPLIPAAKRFPF